jgi:hypothetical protein
VTIDGHGFISVVGAPPITEDILRQPRISHIHGDQGRETLDAMIRQATQPPPTEGAEPQDPCPLVEDVMRIIESSPIRRHYVWSVFYTKLSALQPDSPEKTSKGLLRAVIETIEQEQTTWSKLALLDHSPRIEDLVVSPKILSRAILQLTGYNIEGDYIDSLSLLAHVDQEVGEWARDLEIEMERLAEQVRSRWEHSDNMKWRRDKILEIWTRVRGMLVQGKMEPRFRQFLVRLRDMQPNSSDITLPEPEADDLGLRTEHVEKGFSASTEAPRTIIDLTGLDD